MQLVPYMMFNGQCREAFAFYAKAIGAEVSYCLTYGESPMCDEMPADSRDWIMHSQIEAPGLRLMGADGPPMETQAGAGTVNNLMVDSVEDAERVFAALADGGQVQQPIQETFWALRWGMLVDRYGKPWMVNCSRPE